MEQMTLVEVNSTSGAFGFKTFKGNNSIKLADKFCKTLPKKCKTLSAYIKKTISYE